MSKAGQASNSERAWLRGAGRWRSLRACAKHKREAHGSACDSQNFQIAKERNGKFPRRLRSGQCEFCKKSQHEDLARKMPLGQDPNPGLHPGLQAGVTTRHCTHPAPRGYTRPCLRLKGREAGNACGVPFRAKRVVLCRREICARRDSSVGLSRIALFR